MIHRIYSSLSTFKELGFNPGLNVLIARKEVGATNKQTRNRAGKSSVIELIHFLTGGKVDKKSPFSSKTLEGEHFGMDFDLRGEKVSVQRSASRPSKIRVRRGVSDARELTNSAWTRLLGNRMFDLDQLAESEHAPTFRSMFSYFVRRQSSGGFTVPEKHSTMQGTSDFQKSLLFLLGLDWQIAVEWQNVRNKEKSLKELKKAAGTGALGEIIGRSADLRTQLALGESRLRNLTAELQSFRVLPQYNELEAEADRLTHRIGDLSNANVLDAALVRDLEAALNTEAPPPLTELAAVYEEAGVALPELVIRRYDEVREFHESVVRNRRDYLSDALDAARQRLVDRESEQSQLDAQRSTIMDTLRSHGALESYSRLQANASRMEAELESLRRRYDAAQQLEGTRSKLDIERRQLRLRLDRDFNEQSARVNSAILAFEEVSRGLYESAGSMTVAPTANGPQFEFPIQGRRSKGISNMQIFCFDMMLMRLCADRRTGPGVLVHDSHLFDGVDGRQVISALRTGATAADKYGFQYLVTMNEDDVYKESITGFDIGDYVLPVELTDATEDGGLFGIRFA